MALDHAVEKSLDILISLTNLSTGFLGHPCDRERTIDLIKVLIEEYPDLQDYELTDYLMQKLNKGSYNDPDNHVIRLVQDFGNAFSVIKDSKNYHNWAKSLLCRIRNGEFEKV